VDGRLYGVRYPFADRKGPGPDGNSYAQVFTTRPETVLGDVALIVNPDDERYEELVGRRVTVPFVGREVDVLADDYVDPGFGTGVLKVTPAHDPNDFEIGERHSLPAVNVLNPDGTINENGGPFVGMTREEARKAFVGRLDEEGLLGEVREYRHRVGHCDRCGAVIEPWLSEQWWVSMKELAEPAIVALKNAEITVYPDSWRRETIRWLENLQDWNVSRQLWWGHRIPVWYGPNGEVIAAKESPGEGYEQDKDVLDTWFSSALWPFATLGWPEETEDLEYFYPTALLSTAREIMYLWVARMIMTGLRFRGEVPFGKVNVHSIVLAEDGTKMSKSKGNTIDPLDLFDSPVSSCSTTRAPTRPAASRAILTTRGSQVPSTRTAPGSRLASFSSAISSIVSPRYSVWSRLTLVNTTASGSAAEVASWRAPSPASSTAHSSPASRNIFRAPAVRSSNWVAGISLASATTMTFHMAATNSSSET
jgi:valyl-tRNA synthetase